MVVKKANELRGKTFMINNNIHKYEQYLIDLSVFIKNISNRGDN